jgi:hypothetical protein
MMRRKSVYSTHRLTTQGFSFGRAREAYALLKPKDVVVRLNWLFTAIWIEVSSDEPEDEGFDFRKREERIRGLRVEALQEIWRERGFEGIQALLATSGAARIIGWHLAEGVIDSSEITTLIAECLGLDDTATAAKIDELIGGVMQGLAPNARAETTRSLLAGLTPERIGRLLKCSPFERDTWLHLDGMEPEIRAAYWRDVHPGWMRKDSDINEAIDELLEARRPRAAFQCAQFVFDEVETSRLKRLLNEIATCDSEPAGTYQLDTYDISSALRVLQARPGVTEDEMARLEFLFIQALDHGEYGIPNLERHLAKSPSLFVQVLAVTYKRNDGGEDPAEWGLNDLKHREAAWSAAHTLLDRMKHIPGTNETGKIDAEPLKSWVTEVRALCLKHGRASIGDHQIGKLMSADPGGEDGVWPSEAVREVLEEIGSPEIAEGMAVGVYNARGAHWLGEGGDQERELGEKYRSWAKQVLEYPYVARTLEQIAAQYDGEAVQQDTQSAVRRRLGTRRRSTICAARRED